MDEFLKYYELLLRKASVDFHSAKHLFAGYQRGNSELDIEVVMFHLQQTAEKCLKSILSYHQIFYPKVHDLEFLLRLLSENGINLEIDAGTIIDLSDYAVEGRYGIIQDDLNDIEMYFSEVDLLLMQAKRILSS